MTSRVLTRVDGVLEQELDGEVLLLRRDSADVLHLNAVASALWARLAPSADVGAAAAEIAEDYGVPAERVAGDLAPVVEALLAHGLVVEGAPTA